MRYPTFNATRRLGEPQVSHEHWSAVGDAWHSCTKVSTIPSLDWIVSPESLIPCIPKSREYDLNKMLNNIEDPSYILREISQVKLLSCGDVGTVIPNLTIYGETAEWLTSFSTSFKESRDVT